MMIIYKKELKAVEESIKKVLSLTDFKKAYEMRYEKPAYRNAQTFIGFVLQDNEILKNYAAGCELGVDVFEGRIFYTKTSPKGNTVTIEIEL